MKLKAVKYSDNNDFQLWQQLKNGSELALGKLIKKYFNSLQNYGYKFNKEEDFVKDCVQEVFVEIWNRQRTISQPDSVRAYLFSCVRKKVLRESFRQKIVKNSEITSIENDVNFVDFSPELALIEQEVLNEMTQKVADVLNKLPKRQREVIYLRFYQNLGRDEIAEIMNVNSQSVSNLLQVAFKTFKENWIDFLPTFLFQTLFID
jgi:RNA polymerase sigma factor (sigma-70 family)